MDVIKYSNNGEKIGKVSLPANLFDFDINTNVLYEVIKFYLRNQRQGTKSVKGRSEVKGSTRKLFRQKGTGRARSGSAKSPIKVGGGVAFGPRPKDWCKKIPRKKKRIALKSALSSKREHVAIIEDFVFDKPSTKTANQILKNMEIDYEKCLIIIPDNSMNVIKSFSNLKNVYTARSQDLCSYEVMRSSDLVITEKALQMMEDTFTHSQKGENE
ncbi:MAG: 50S ribosomal protein L4 [Candidatus Cloacimonetes bacterium]|nr:50S ribosomal protein L4 [Candidatus Cloacimonadota bacterium]